MAIKKIVREDLSGVDFVENDKVLLSVDVKDLSKEILQNLALHGISQKVGDSYVGCKSTEEAMEKAAAVVERLKQGNWNAVRTASSPRATQLAEALAEAYDKTVEEAITALSKLTDEQKKAVRKDARVKAALESIKARKAAERAEKLAQEAQGDDVSDLTGQLFG